MIKKRMGEYYRHCKKNTTRKIEKLTATASSK
jgi:hypothetical protein